jgi:hypothetical protein
MRSKLGDIARLKHILDAIVEIENYLLNNNFDEADITTPPDSSFRKDGTPELIASIDAFIEPVISHVTIISKFDILNKNYST